MNPNLAGQLASCHLRDLRQAAVTRAVHHDAGHSGASRQPAAPGRRTRALRHRLGFVMIEAGLRLATDMADTSGVTGS